MASDISRMFGNAVKECIDDISKQEDEKVRIALDRTMNRVRDKINDFLRNDMVRAYYEGYDPLWYQRKGQLGRSVEAYTETHAFGQNIGFSFGVEFDETKMNHSTYRVRGKWYSKRRKQWVDYEYNVTPKQRPSEKGILENFQQGIHPKAVLAGYTETPNAEPLFTNSKQGSVPDLIESWVESGGIVNIFQSEISKLH